MPVGTRLPDTADRPARLRWALNLAAGLAPALPADDRDAEAALQAAVTLPDAHLLPVVVAALKQRELIGRLPAALRETMIRRQLEATALFLRQKAWLQKFISEILPADVPVMLLQGWAFHGTIYRDDEPRVGGDIDLLFRECDYERVCALFGKLAEPVELYKGRPCSRRTRFENGFWIDGDHRLCVEPHRCLVNPGLVKIDHDALWKRSLAHPAFGDERVRIPAAEDALLHLAAHSAMNQNCAPHTLVDACRLLRGCKPDLAVVSSRANEWGIGAVTKLMLSRVGEMFDMPKPAIGSLSPMQRFLGRRCLPVDRRTDDDDRPAFRLRQMLSLGLLDRPLLVIPFLLRYAGLRILDVICRLTGNGNTDAELSPAGSASSRESQTQPGSLASAADRYAMYRGLSMYPTFHDRDLVVVEPLGSRPPRKGDVIYFDSPSRGCRVIHRVIRVRANSVQTQGDSNDRPDDFEPTADFIIGRVESACRPGREWKVANGWRGACFGYIMRCRNGLARAVAPYRRRNGSRATAALALTGAGEDVR